MAKKPVKKKDASSRDAADSPADEYEDEILSRFLVDKKDNILGESIGIEGDDVILKHKNRFYLVPRSAMKLKGKKLVLTRKVDWVGAKAKGEGWRREELDPLWGKKTSQVKKPVPKKKGPIKKSEAEAAKKNASGKKNTSAKKKTKEA